MSRGAGGPGPAARPQVNLLPPEVRARRALGRIKSYLVLSLALVLLVACGGVVMAILTERSAAAELADAQAETQRLVNEQAQYSEVPKVLNQISELESVRLLGMSTEIIWSDYIRAIEAVAPSEMALLTITTSTPSPLQGPMPAVNPLAAPSVGAVTFTGRSLSLPDTAAWIDALESIPGFADAVFSSAAVSEEEGVIFYEVSSTVQVNEQAFALRFLTEGVQP